MTSQKLGPVTSSQRHVSCVGGHGAARSHWSAHGGLPTDDAARPRRCQRGRHAALGAAAGAAAEEITGYWLPSGYIRQTEAAEFVSGRLRWRVRDAQAECPVPAGESGRQKLPSASNTVSGAVGIYIIYSGMVSNMIVDMYVFLILNDQKNSISTRFTAL